MMSNPKPAHQPPQHAASPEALVLPLDPLNHTLLPLVGGKAAQLGELIRAGFAVPTGFCVTTTAYARVAASAELDTLLGALSTWRRLIPRGRPNSRQPCAPPSCVLWFHPTSPPVVGVVGAVERIRTGQRITVDGGAGTVMFAPENDISTHTEAALPEM